MKHSNQVTLLALALLGALSAPVAHAALHGEVEYKDGQYLLSWQSTSPVRVLVNTTDTHQSKVLVENTQQNRFSWPAEADSRHYFTLENHQGDSLTLASRLIPLEGGRNFRDLGGYQTTDGKQVKWGKLYRSGVLANLSEADYQLIDELNIATVVDFRTSSERASEKTQWQASPVEMINRDYEMADMSKIAEILRAPDLSREKLEGFMAQAYVGIVEDQKQNYTAMFDRLVNKDGGLLFHCTAGKDRTGISAALILTALGVDRQTVIDDYLATNEYLDPDALMPKDTSKMDPKYAAMMKFFASLPKDVAQPLMGVTQPLIESAIASMEAKHGSVLAYIQNELQVSDQDLAVLREKFLD